MSPRKIILDCDPGQDDAVAILLALASPELDVIAITVVAGNIGLETTSWNARALVELAGCTTPVHAGCPRPLVRDPIDAVDFHGETGIAGASLSPPVHPLAHRHAVDMIRDLVRGHDPGEITLVATAPLTNLACALVQAPDIAPRLSEIVLMGGAIGPGNTTAAAEFNMLADPHAAAVVFGSGARIVMTPLELTHQAVADRARSGAIRALGNECGRQVADILESYVTTTAFGDAGGPLHDPCAVGYVLWPELMSGRGCHVEVVTDRGDDLGRTRIGPPSPGRRVNAHVLERIDADGFFRRLTERLGRLP